MRNLIGLLVVACIAVVAYKVWFSQMKSEGAGTPAQTIDVVGVKMDLLAIAQGERTYQAEHGAYVPLDQLVSSGAINMTRSGRDGFTYDVEVSDSGFQAVAHCPNATFPGCTDWSVGPTMDVQPAP
jgi:hypothetical protein